VGDSSEAMKETTEANQVWTEEITSDTPWYNVPLKELWHYRDLLRMLVKKDYVTFYKQTILGPLWFFIQPLLTTLIFMVLFGQIAKLSTNGVPQLAFYLAGITLWNYFSEALTKTATVFKDQAPIMGKVYFPRLIMPLSIVCSGLMKLGIQFLLFVVVVVYYAYTGLIQPNWTVALTPLLVMMMAMLSLGLGMIFSALTTKYKDLVFLLTFGVQLLMYASPVVYGVSTVPAKWQWLMAYNPLTGLFEAFRYAYLGVGEWPMAAMGYTMAATSVIFLLGVFIFNKVEKSFMDTV
jgi:lipopolysaccharide transport system permease protein